MASRKFFDDPDKKIIKENLFTEIAFNEIKKFLKVKKEIKKGKEKIKPLKGTPSPTQVRKFYNEILKIKQKIDSKKDSEKYTIFRKQLPYIKMIKTLAVYSNKRDNVNQEFVNFLNSYIDEINDLDDFYVFCDFFEAIIAYYTAEYPK